MHDGLSFSIDEPQASLGLAAKPRPIPWLGQRAGEATGIRPLEERDIAQICDLFTETFRPGRTVRRADIEACLGATYLTSPGDRIRPASLVDVGPGGRVRGFMGIITLAARFGDKALRGGMLGNFMAHDADRAKSGARLARATVHHDLDFVFTDTANRTSLDLSLAMKFEVLPLHSLEWVKVLRPFATANALLGRSVPALGWALQPLVGLADLAGRRLPLAVLPPLDQDGILDRPITLVEFAARAPAFVTHCRLRPGWEQTELDWLLDQARRKSRNGQLQAREVADRQGRMIGLYLIYAKPGAVAQVLQVLAQRKREAAVFTALIRAAGALGAVAVRGQSSPLAMRGLMRQSGIAYHHVAATIVFARDPELREAFRSEEACLGGLLGEGWTRLVADEFA